MDEKFNKCIAKFDRSCMSNAKWRKLFSALADLDIKIERAEWKYIDEEKTDLLRLPEHNEFGDDSLADGYFQPIEFKWIEWIRIPISWRSRPDVGYEKKQDLDKIQAALQSTGHFEFERTDNDITIFGYK